MNELIAWELQYVLECFCLGAGLMLAYSFLQMLRRIIRHSYIVVSIEDILYWIMAGCMMFSLLYKEDAGNIRWFAVGITFAGMLTFAFFTKSTGKKVTELLKKIVKEDRIERRVKGVAQGKKR